MEGIVVNRPTIRSANILYLLGIVLVLTAGGAMQMWSFGLGLLGTELLLILGPALMFMRRNNVPASTTLRLRWPGGRLVVLSLLIGAGVWLVDTWLGTISVALLGYSTPSVPGMYPTTVDQAALLFVAMGIAAPVCEEIFFRGYIMRAYEGWGARSAIVMTSMLFVFFHVNVENLLALLPVALVLGYVVWRSDSLVPGILVHLANNVVAAAFLITSSFRPDLEVGVPSLPTAAGGVVVLLISLWLFRRSTAGAQPIELPGQIRTRRMSVGAVWPLVVAGLVFAVVGAAEVVVGRFPQALAADSVTLGPAPWDRPVRWEYELRNILEEPVGQASYSLVPSGSDIVLEGQERWQPFEARKDRSYFNIDGADQRRTVRWQRDTLQLVEATAAHEAEQRRLTAALTTSGDGSLVEVTQTGQPTESLRTPSDGLLVGEWPWRLSSLPFQAAYSGQAELVWLNRWREETHSSGPVVEPILVVVAGAEPVATRAGNFIAWRVRVGNQTAWYDVNPPHTLVRYDDGVLSYRLTSVE